MNTTTKATVVMVVVMMALCALALVPEGTDADVWDGQAVDTAWVDGYGTESEFEISTAAQLAGLAELVNGGRDFAGKTVRLAEGVVIDISGHEWTPIGEGSRSGSGYTADSTPFRGTFDGQNSEIKGLTIKTTEGADNAVGLFGIVAGGTVEHITLTSVDIDVSGTGGSTVSSEMAGAVVGMLCEGGTISWCTVGSTDDGSTIKAGRGNGGIVGRMTVSGTIEWCQNYAAVTGTSTGGNTGGIVGAAYYTGEDQDETTMIVRDCENHGVVSGYYGVGGIVGLSSATISDCDNYGEVKGNGSSVGGIVGEQQNFGFILRCENDGAVSNSAVNNTDADDQKDLAGMGTGGIVGWIRYSGADTNYPTKATVTLIGCGNRGEVETDATHCGGIVGALYHSAVIQDCVSYGNIDGANFTGGIVGGMQTLDNLHPSDGCRLEITGCTVGDDVRVTGGAQNGLILGHFTAEGTSDTQGCKAPGNSHWTVYGNNVSDETVSQIESVAIADISGMIRGYITLAQALSEAQDGTTVKLISDVREDVVFSSGSVTLDLNGCRVTAKSGDAISVSNGATLIITNNQDSGAGAVESTNEGSSPIAVDGATVIIEAGRFIGDLAIAVTGFGNVSVSGGSFGSDVSEWCVDGYLAFADGDMYDILEGYTITYTVGEKVTSEKVLKGGFPEEVPELPETEPGYSYMWLLEDGTLWDSAQAVTSDLDVIAKHYISDFYVTVSLIRDDQGNAILRAEWNSDVDLVRFEYDWSFGGSEYATEQECTPIEYGIYIARVTAYDADGVEAYSYYEFDYQSAHTVTFQFPDGTVRTYEVEHNQCLTEIPPLEAPENYRYIWVEDSDRGYSADTTTPITEDVTYKAVLVMTGMTADVVTQFGDDGEIYLVGYFSSPVQIEVTRIYWDINGSGEMIDGNRIELMEGYNYYQFCVEALDKDGNRAYVDWAKWIDSEDFVITIDDSTEEVVIGGNTIKFDSGEGGTIKESIDKTISFNGVTGSTGKPQATITISGSIGDTQSSVEISAEPIRTETPAMVPDWFSASIDVTVRNVTDYQMTITVPVEMPEHEDVLGVVAYYYNTLTGYLEQVECSLDPASGLVSIFTDHNTDYYVYLLTASNPEPPRVGPVAEPEPDEPDTPSVNPDEDLPLPPIVIQEPEDSDSTTEIVACAAAAVVAALIAAFIIIERRRL